MKRFYLVCAVLGTIGPWLFFAGFLGEHGSDLPLLTRSVFANSAAAAFTTDVLVSLVVFEVWATHDARRGGVRHG